MPGTAVVLGLWAGVAVTTGTLVYAGVLHPALALVPPAGSALAVLGLLRIPAYVAPPRTGTRRPAPGTPAPAAPPAPPAPAAGEPARTPAGRPNRAPAAHRPPRRRRHSRPELTRGPQQPLLTPATARPSPGPPSARTGRPSGNGAHGQVWRRQYTHHWRGGSSVTEVTRRSASRTPIPGSLEPGVRPAPPRTRRRATG
ncbi:hypothetical protein SCYAM73S_06185 [Streptomyces cyaneofuscatus]